MDGLMKKLWKWIKRFFTNDYSEPSRDYGSHGETDKPEFKPRWGIIIPHTNKAPGASGYRPSGVKISEYKYGLEMSMGIPLPYATRDRSGVKGAAESLKSRGCNASLEPHKNAFNKKAHGFEILVLKGDKLSAQYARLFADAFADKYPERRLRHDKGIKWISKGDRGYHNLVAAKKAGMDVALLSESFFLDNQNEWISPEEMAAFWDELLVMDRIEDYDLSK